MKLLDVFAQLCNARPLSKDTLANYRRACVYFGNHLGRDAEVDDLSTRKVNEWLVYCEKLYEPEYIRSLRRDLLVVWNFAADIEECSHPKSRLIRTIRIRNENPTSWPNDWIPRLLEAAENVTGKIRGYGCPRSWYAVAYLRVELELLCRPTDMRHLLWCQIQGERVEFIQHKTGRHQVGSITRDTVRALGRIQGLHSQYVFPLGKTANELLIRKVFATAGIDKPKGESLGHLRHTGGTSIAKTHGNDAARKALGHAPTSRVFERHYLDPSRIPKPEAVKWWEG